MSTKITLDTLKKYKLIVYPHPTIVTDYTAKLLEEYVAHGGNLIIGARSGYKDINGQCPMAEMPGKLSSLFGVTINDFTAMSDLEQDRHAIWDEDEIDMPLFNDIISPKSNTCTVLATYKEDYYAGQPALTVNRYGKGNAYYLGSAFSLNAAKKILTNLGYDEPYSNIIELPECCEIAIRTKGNTKYMFILNYNSIIETITLKKPLTNLLTNEILNGKVALEKYGVLILGF
jgi:beta-galactosidase